MLVPSDERPDCVASICYLNHVEDGGGATGIVPRCVESLEQRGASVPKEWFRKEGPPS